jgi:pimeloyl-ACP methyl ester carboxylesterase/DNA-binding CsgD family transcriptional regulator
MDAPPVQYVKTPDGFDIAYTVIGSGQPLVAVPGDFHHVQLNWKNRFQFPSRLAMYEQLAERFQLVNFDYRGQGLSQRGLQAKDVSIEKYLLDLETVVDSVGLDRFILLGVQGGGHVAIQYAVKHRDRISALVLNSTPVSNATFPSGMFALLPTQNWDFFLRSVLTPGLSQSDIQLGVELLQQTFTQSDRELLYSVFGNYDVSDWLPLLEVPALIIQASGFRLVPPEESARLSAQIRGSRMVVVDGEGGFGDVTQAVRALENFLADLQSREEGEAVPPDKPANLSQRETEVLRLVAQGKSNRHIADELVISLNTVNRHVSNIFDKTGVANRTEAANYAHRHHLV